MMDTDWIQADSGNLPAVDVIMPLMVAEYFARHTSYFSSEIKGVKTSR